MILIIEHAHTRDGQVPLCDGDHAGEAITRRSYGCGPALRRRAGSFER
jgi:hypothetical protein